MNAFQIMLGSEISPAEGERIFSVKRYLRCGRNFRAKISLVRPHLISTQIYPIINPPRMIQTMLSVIGMNGKATRETSNGSLQRKSKNSWKIHITACDGWDHMETSRTSRTRTLLSFLFSSLFFSLLSLSIYLWWSIGRALMRGESNGFVIEKIGL